MHLTFALYCVAAASAIDAVNTAAWGPPDYPQEHGHHSEKGSGWQPWHTWHSQSSTRCPSNPMSTTLQQSSYWSGWGGDNLNNRWASNNTAVNSNSVLSLKQQCKYTYHRGVSATPTVDGDLVYYPTWSGLLVALNYKTCQVMWEVDVVAIVEKYKPQNEMQKMLLFQVARASPAIDGDMLYIGTQPQALMLAINKHTGQDVDAIQLNSHPFAVVTMSATVQNGRIFIGAASREEAAARGIPQYACCSFVANMVALDFDRSTNKFNVAWNVTMLPIDTAWSGSALWGSQPSVDIKRNQIFIATGNVYTLPTAFEACRNQTMNITVIEEGLTRSPCVPRNVYQESVLALDMDTGYINWVQQLNAIDAWTAACGFGGSLQKPTANRLPPPNCPYIPGPDADFGMMPTFIEGSSNTPNGQDTVVIGQKNGNLYAMSAQAGRVFWATATSPDGNIGGLSWGLAVDAEQVYYTAVNSALKEFTLEPSGKNITNSAFGSAALKNGSVLWETRSPDGSFSIVLPSVVNDVALFGRTGNGTSIVSNYDLTPGGLIPVHKRTGNIIKDYNLDANFHGGIAIQDGYLMFGTGYEPSYNGTGSFHVWSV